MQDNDLISRAAARDVINTWGRYEKEVVRMYLLHNYINAIPAVDAAPVVHGRWIEDRTDIVCGVCGARYKDEIVFMPDVYVNGKRYDGLEHCPHCGAKLDGGETNADG